MRYKRDLRGIKLRQQRDAALNTLSKIPKRIPPWGWLLLLILSLLLFMCFYMGSNIFSDPEYVQLDNSIVADRYIKQVVINSDVSETESERKSEETIIVANGAPDIKSHGEKITDTTKNPLGLPIYDGYSYVGESFYVDYSRFFNATDDTYGLGDFTNKEVRNIVTFEGRRNSRVHIDSTIDKFSISEDRLIVAMAPGALIDPEIYEPEIESFWANPAKYTYKLDGTNALVYKAGQFDGAILKGTYVDIVLADGTVIAGIIGDTKALHDGITNNGELCKDYLLKGYAHWRQSGNAAPTYSTIEIAGTANPKLSELNLENNKIVGVRVYKDTKGRFK